MEGSDARPVEEQVVGGEDRAAELLDALEFFCASGEFTGFIQEFSSAHAMEFTDDGEQSLRHYDLYKQYHDGIEAKLSEFCASQGVSEEQLLHIIATAHQTDYGSTTCLDYIVASSEYDAFLQLMLDCKSMHEYMYGEGGDGDDGLLGGLEDEQDDNECLQDGRELSADEGPPSSSVGKGM